jgi:hypothetical protein
MATDDVLKKTWSTDKAWYKLSDPAPPDVRKARGSRTLQDHWFYGADERLELRFETEPERGFAIYYRDERLGFSTDITPESVPGDSIRAAKRLAVQLWEDRSRKAAPQT